LDFELNGEIGKAATRNGHTAGRNDLHKIGRKAE